MEKTITLRMDTERKGEKISEEDIKKVDKLLKRMSKKTFKKMMS